MPVLLRHIPTGDLYVSTPFLLARDDMEQVVEESAPEEAAQETVAEVLKKTPRQKKTADTAGQ